MLAALIRPLFATRPDVARAQELYITLARQSRNPFFYAECGVPDTLDGRFDTIVLHLFLALHYLGNLPLDGGGRRAEGEAGGGDDTPLKPYTPHPNPPPQGGREFQAIDSQLLLEAFFADMDRSLREMGVGDMGVGKRVQKMGKAAFGRLKAYKDAWENDEALKEALVRNAYRGVTPAPEALGKLVAYMRDWRA